MFADLSRLTDPWLRDFPPPTVEEFDKYKAGGSVAEFAALTQYSRRAGVSMGPAKMMLDALRRLPA